MLRVAVDVDHTITRFPAQCRELMAALRRQFHYVMVLTGHAADPAAFNQAQRDEKYRQRVEQLAALGIHWDSHYLHLVSVIGVNSDACAIEKGRECRERGIQIFIDDSTSYCRAVRGECPDAMILKVFE